MRHAGRVDGVLRFGLMAAADPFERLKTRVVALSSVTWLEIDVVCVYRTRIAALQEQQTY